MATLPIRPQTARDTIPVDPRFRPSYPQDRFLTDDEIATMARSASLVRAHSPNEVMCRLDSVSSVDNPPLIHTPEHSYSEYMNYRYEHVIGPSDPWTPWEEYDDWAQEQPGQPLPPPAGAPQEGWNPIFRVRPLGISEMDSIGNAANVSFAVSIDPSVMIMPTNDTIRVRFCGPMNIQEVYIGPVADPSNPWVCSWVTQLTFNGAKNVSISPGLYPPWYDPFGQAASDPISTFDMSNGVVVSFYILGGSVGRRLVEPGWVTNNASGQFFTDGSSLSGDPDKSGSNWVQAGSAVLGVLMIESYWPPDNQNPWPPFPWKVRGAP